MAGSRPTNFGFNADDDDDERQRPDNVYINPERIDRRIKYVSGLNSDVDSYPTTGHNHHPHNHHQNNPRTLPTLTIRRHPHGSNNPSLQKLPINSQSSSDNISSSLPIHVTIKRNPIQLDQPIIQPEQIIIQPDQTIIRPDQTFIQPIFYPVAVYVNSPVPQYPNNQPIQPIQPIQEIKKPPSPKKPISPVKTSPVPPMSPNRYEVESFQPPTPPLPKKNTNTSPRRPVRIDLITPAPAPAPAPAPTPSPPTLDPKRVRSGKVVVEEFDEYDEYYRAPSVYSVPRKVVSYRTVPGPTTRELENDLMNNVEEPIYVQSPELQTVTYRVS